MVYYLSEYLSINRIVKIGDDTQDIIVRDWKDFLIFLYSHDFYVTYILWWEHIFIDDVKKGGETLGGGGPIDPFDHRFFFGETFIEHDFNEKHTRADIEQYIEKTINQYKPYVLQPSFTVKKRTM